MRGSHLVVRDRWTGAWRSVVVVALLGAGGLSAGTPWRTVALAASTSGPVTPPPGGDHSGLVVVGVLVAVVLVALWRVLLRLVVVALVALVVIGLFVVLAPGVARADPVVSTAAASGGPGSLPVIALVVVAAAVFLVGLLVGEQWHRHQVARRDRQLADARRELAELMRGRRDARGG